MLFYPVVSSTVSHSWGELAAPPALLCSTAVPCGGTPAAFRILPRYPLLEPEDVLLLRHHQRRRMSTFCSSRTVAAFFTAEE